MSFSLEIEPLGECLDVEEEQTLLDAALRQGFYIPHACCHGLCGTCKVQVLEGEVEHNNASPFALMDFEREEGMTLACCATARSDVIIEADVEEEPDAVRQPVEDYEGVVQRIEKLSPSAVAVFLELDRDLEFQAGKYLNLWLPEIESSRAFSMANSPSEKRLVELNVRRVPGGEATTYIHEKLKKGDRLRVSAPYGRFFLRASAPEDVIFLAGGTGISSPKSMILDMLEKGDQRNITLVYGQRNVSELYYDALFRGLADNHPNFRYIPALSEPEETDDWNGETGFVHEVAEKAFEGRFSGHKAYICGPPAMIDACVTTLMRGRLFERDMYMEKFFTAADSAQSTRRSPLFKNL